MSSNQKNSKPRQRKQVVYKTVQTRTPAKLKKSPSKKTTKWTIDSGFTDILNSFTSSVSKPAVLLSIIAISAFVVTHSSSFSTSIVGKWANDHKNTTIGKWVSENDEKLLGLAVFAPAVLNSPNSIRVMLILCSFLWIVLIPENSVYQYCLQSLALHTYFKVRNPKSRFLVIAVVVIAYIAGFLVVK
ncbi:hypothetical protein 3 [Big Cypress virus]|uniref:hypothetical protein 3 n=1 Tax=Big Cypress virus TaxID=1955196 RepID=UPI000994DEB1|nr:hypothetical protein 3 [Big Cypress virus]AQM55268.1 hypothetical protein 3 [Big Cypress virus]AQM55271.1 hypothetical protein 3 [Big Cypress virus]AQM55274.1 hypothetical protein 3 [Big Cypress virus]AQM55277.1 hypothetical protein 3 [Big Cypress virus]AQM55280.1 hypothetical protein 3 [Big Cypress virus]